MDVSSYSQVDVEVSQDTFKPLSSKNPLLAGGEGLGQNNLSNDFDGDTFSATTSATFTANMAMGNVDGIAAQEKVGNIYDYSIDLITSFDGNDSLDVSIIAGEGGNTLTELDLNETNDGLQVDTIAYTRSLGDKLTVFFGDGIDGNSLYSTACAYEGQTNVLDDCGAMSTAMGTGYGTGAGLSVDLGGNFALAFGYEGEGINDDGLLSDEGADAYGFQASYIADNYGISISWANVENAVATNNPSGYELTGGETTFTAINAFFTPDLAGFPSFSVGFESSDNDNIADATIDETSHWFVGLQFEEVGNGTLGAALGTKEPTVENADSQLMWEAYYAYNYADGITITPLVYVKENTAVNTDDETGIILKTTFEF
tara:strand:- start:814 stop:1929 length:1116 start_codon:yes stop_codon:yes gene_type:complete